jgi:hypothetical protein
MSIPIPIPIRPSPTVPVPPLRQSVYEDMACPRLYVAKHVERIADFTTAAANRGTELHEIFATYISHLVQTGRKKDLRFFDRLARKASEDAREVLVKFRDNHEFDPNTIVGTELEIKLDSDFNPIDADTESQNGNDDQVAYKGTLDLVQLHSLTEAEITDWKTYFSVVEANSFQSKQYILLLFCLNPSLQRIKFVLQFVRYGASRSVEYTRADVPMLKQIVERERKRQHELHSLALAHPEAIKAAPGRHCTWCPLVFNSCPLAGRNQYQHKTPQELLGYVIWLRETLNKNTEVLKHWGNERGCIQYRDGNGKVYTAGYSPISKTEYPYAPTASIVGEWVEEHPNDKALGKNLTVSNLGNLLKAKKRAALRAKLAAVARTRVETRFEISRIDEDEASDEVPTVAGA